MVSGTERLPAERFEIWRDQMIEVVGPVSLEADDPASFRSEVHAVGLGGVQLTSLMVSPCRGRRTAKMIRQADPEVFQLIAPLSGRTQMTQGRRHTNLQMFDLALYDTSHPWEMYAGVDGAPIKGIQLTFPYTLLPLPPHKVGSLSVVSGRDGIGALLWGFLNRLHTGSDQYGPVSRARLGTILLDLLATQLAHQGNTVTSLPPETRRQSLQTKIHAFIHKRLADPDLTPAVIAAAHGISVRQLQRLFQDQGMTVTGWIRGRRLERCRRDLTDPLLQDRPIYAIAARWGLSSPAHFTRLFRDRYEIGPREYRDLARRETDGSPPCAACGQ
jgi:AraC-like DNA-binding protein